MTFADRGRPASGGEPPQDRKRIVELYSEIRPALSGYLYSRGLSQDHTEDIIQETFLRLVRHGANSGADDNLRAWVFRVAHNLSMDLHRAERRWFRNSENDPQSIFQERIDP